MTNSTVNDLRCASSIQAADMLQALPAATKEELQAALINAFERIAALERDWEDVGRACRWFNSQVGDRAQKP